VGWWKKLDKRGKMMVAAVGVGGLIGLYLLYRSRSASSTAASGQVANTGLVGYAGTPDISVNVSGSTVAGQGHPGGHGSWWDIWTGRINQLQQRRWWISHVWEPQARAGHNTHWLAGLQRDWNALGNQLAWDKAQRSKHARPPKH